MKRESQQGSTLVNMEASTRGIRMRRMRRRNLKRNYDVTFISPQSLPSCHAVFAFLDPLLVGILEVHYQSSRLSPFETHKANMWVFLLAIFIYCFAVAHYNISYPKLVASVVLITGSLASVSILSIFLPHLLGQLIFVIWIFLPIYIARSLIMNVGQRVFQAFRSELFKVMGNCNSFMGSDTREKRRCFV